MTAPSWERGDKSVGIGDNVHGMSDSPRPPHWLLRWADQAVVAALIGGALAAMMVWCVVQGGCQDRLIEIDRSEPLSARFEVDINTADLPELMQLPGIGDTLARRIVESRAKDGLFAANEDLRRVDGIGAKTLEKLLPYLRPQPSRGAMAP